MLAGALAVAGVLAGPVDVRAEGVAGNGAPRVTFINPGISGEVFWSLVARAMGAAAKQLEIDLEVRTAERNRVRMKEMALETINAPNPPDALILVNEEQASVELLEAANARGIKTLMLLNDVVGSDRQATGEPRTKLSNWLGAIIPDNRNAGRRMARKLLAFARAKDPSGEKAPYHLMAFYGDTITPASMERNGGLADVIAEEPDLVLDRTLIADWNEQKAKLLMNRVLKRSSRSGVLAPIGIWAANDPIALGAISALRDNGIKPGSCVGVVGLNWSPAALEAIEDGSLLMSDGGHFFAGAWAMVVLRDYFDGHDQLAEEPTVHFAMSPVDSSNLADFKRTVGSVIVRDTFEQIDYSSFLLSRRSAAKDYDFSLDALIGAVRTQ